MPTDPIANGEWTPERYAIEVNRVIADSLAVPPDQKLGFLKTELAKFPQPYRKAAENLVLHTEAIVNHQSTPLWERIAIFAFGVLFLLILLAIALFVPNPTDFQLFVFRVVLSLVAAAIAALIPGFLNIQSDIYRNSIRAGGAIAVFVIVYLINPPKLVTKPTHSEHNQARIERTSLSR